MLVISLTSDMINTVNSIHSTELNMNRQISRSSAIRLASLSALALSVIAAPSAVLAGEAFVNNTVRHSTGFSKTDLNIKSRSFSDGQRQFASFADKLFVDGKIQGLNGLTKGGKNFSSEANVSSSQPKAIKFNEFTVHTASSSEFGNETFGERTNVDGTVFTREDFSEFSHTTSAGVR